MEAPLLRWLYARRRPNQSFKIAFDQEIQRLYDEWDALERKVARRHGRAGGRGGVHPGRRHRRRPAAAHAAPAAVPDARLDRRHHDRATTSRRCASCATSTRPTRSPSLDEARPRLDCAQHWVTTQVPAEQRTHVRAEPDVAAARLADDAQRESLRLLLDGLDAHWSLDGLTTLVYGVPKTQLGLPLDAKPTPELKVAQRAFFALLYQLLVGRDTGPRLPTLLLAVGADRVRKLLAA